MTKQNEKDLSLFLSACNSGDLAVLKKAVQGVTETLYFFLGAEFAIRAKKISTLEYLLPRIPNQVSFNRLLQVASEIGDIEAVKLILPHADPKANSSLALRSVLLGNHEDLVDCLWGVSNVKDVLEWIFERDWILDDEKHGVGFRAAVARFHAEESRKNIQENLSAVLDEKKDTQFFQKKL